MSVSLVKIIEPCVSCEVRTSSPVMGEIGRAVGKLCPDCAFWCDGNIIPAR